MSVGKPVLDTVTTQLNDTTKPSYKYIFNVKKKEGEGEMKYKRKKDYKRDTKRERERERNEKLYFARMVV